MFRFTYQDLPPDLREQMEAFLSAHNADGRDLRE
jgi:hypothetical protein